MTHQESLRIKINSGYRAENLKLTEKLEKLCDENRINNERIDNLQSEINFWKKKCDNLERENNELKEKNNLLKSQVCLSNWSQLDKHDIHLFTNSEKYNLLRCEKTNGKTYVEINEDGKQLFTKGKSSIPPRRPNSPPVQVKQSTKASEQREPLISKKRFKKPLKLFSF